MKEMGRWMKAAGGWRHSLVQLFCCAQAMHLVKPFMTVPFAASFVFQASAKCERGGLLPGIAKVEFRGFWREFRALEVVF